MAEAGAEDNGAGPDRTRVTRACDNCKIRRARCRIIPSTAADTNPICFGCRENNLNCSYTAPHRKRGPQPGFRKNTNTQSPVAAQSSTSSVYGQPSTSRRPWEDGPSGSLGTVIASTPQQYDNDKEEVPDVKLPLLGLPSEMVDQLLAVYFTHVHNVWPIIYKPLFNPHTTSPPLLLSILAIASCVSEPYPSASAQSPHGPAVRYDAEKLSLMAERSLREALEREEIRIDLIQALVIMSLRQTGNGHKESAFMYGGRACLGVLSLGLNLKATGKISQVDGEIRSRVFWNVYVLDKCLAEETGRPYLLPFQRCSVPIPSAQETDELETWPPPPTSSSSSSLPTSVRHIVPRRGYVMSCFQWSCRLGKVFENILDLDNQLKSSEEGHTWDKEYDDWQQSRSMDAHVTELVDQLDRWRKNVPEWLLVDTRAHVSPLPHLVVLSALLLHSRFTRKRYPLVQPFLHLDQLINTSRTTCSEAAQDSIDLFAHLDRFRLLIQVSSDVIHILSMTTLFEAFDSTNPDERLAHRAKLNFAQCCIWLRDFSASWPSASAHKLFFDGLIQGGLRLTTSDSAETSSADGNGPEGLERIDRDRYRTFGNNLTGIHEHATTSDLSQPTLPDPSYGANGLSPDIFQLPQYYWNHLTTTAESIVPKQPQQPDQTQGVYDQMPVNHMSLMSPTWTGAEGNLHPERSDLPWERVDSAPAQYLPAGAVPAAAAGDMSANVVGGDMADQSQTAIYTALMDYMFQAARSQ